MRVKRLNRGYTIFATEHEFTLLQRMMTRFNIKEEWPSMATGERQSWSRRIHKGDFLRVDQDKSK